MNKAINNPSSNEVLKLDRHRRLMEAANILFSDRGYFSTTIKDICDLAGFSVGYFYKHFEGKQEVLDELTSKHLDVYEGIRAYTRTNPDLSPLDCFRQEMELMCKYMVEHRHLIPTLFQRENNNAVWIEQRFQQHRQQDIELLDRARLMGEIDDVDPTLLHAVLDGAVWGLLKTMAKADRGDVFMQIPGIIDDLVIKPIARERKN